MYGLGPSATQVSGMCEPGITILRGRMEVMVHVDETLFNNVQRDE